MGVLDKIKNALFEVEYVEVDEPPKKEKEKKKKKNKDKEKEEKPIAKKIVLPGRRDEKVEEIEEEELKDEDFEIRPKNEVIKEAPTEEFKFMDDNDFKVDDDFVPEEPEIVHVIDNNSNNNQVDNTKDMNMEQISTQKKTREEKNEQKYNSYYQDDFNFADSYNTKSEEYHEHDTRLYGMDNSVKVSVPQYGVYEKKEDKVYFKPSPIISPIYGILDKNYHKEDVKEKKEVRITTNYSRSKLNVDDIRAKAYGKKESINDEFNNPKEEDVVEEVVEDTSFEIDDDDDNLLVDLSDKAKPEVKEITMGDALEYFQDLGLEYNVDYVDASGNDKKVSHENNKNKKRSNNTKNVNTGNNKIEKHDYNEKKNKEKDVFNDDSDNLFDLIDSMYQESE